MALSLAAFVVVSFLAFLAAGYLLDGVLLPIAIAVFCGLATATVVNATNIMARRTERNRTGDGTGTDARNDRQGNGRAP